MRQRPRFYADEHVPTAVVRGLQERGIDVLTTQEAEMRGASDNAQLRFATNENRIIVTQDADFLRLHASGIKHCGIAYSRQHAPIGEMVRSLLLIDKTLDSAEMKSHVEFF